MCGKETSGIDAADPSMFEHAPWVLTRDEPRITELVEAVGAHPIVMDAVTHDRLVAGVSHAAFLLSVGYVLALSRRQEWPEASRLAAGGFRDMSRLAAGDPNLYAGVVRDRKSTRLNSSHSQISYAVFCLKKKKKRQAEVTNMQQPNN